MTSRLHSLFPLLKYINIPVVITLAGIVSSLIALFWISNLKIHTGVIFLLLAILMDQLDGLAARKLNQISVFGGYLDVFGDFMAYCLFPVVTIYSFIPESAIVLLSLCALLLAGGMRLAHYMTTNSKDIVIGIPCCVLLILLPWRDFLPAPWLTGAAVVYSLTSAAVFSSSLNIQRHSMIGKSLIVLLVLTAGHVLFLQFS